MSLKGIHLECENIFICHGILPQSLWIRPRSHFPCHGILTPSLWIMPRSHFCAMGYWPSHSELCLSHTSMPWDIDPVTLNYALVTFPCHGILTQSLWIMPRSHFCAMGYWPSHSELCLSHTSMPWDIDPVTLNYALVTFPCHGILTQSLWIMPRSHFHAMGYWPHHSELCLGHISVPWDIDPITLNYALVTLPCHGILTQSL